MEEETFEPENIRDRVIKDTTRYSAASYMGQGLALIRGLIIPKLLQSVESYGLYQSLILILEYTIYSPLGMLQALNKEVPIYKGKKDQKTIDLIRNNTFIGSLVTSILVAIVVFILSFFIGGEHGEFFRWGLKLIAIMIPFQVIFGYLIIYLHVENRFRPVSLAAIMLAGLNLVLSVILIWLYDIHGLVISLVLTYILTTLWLTGTQKFEIRFRINREKMKNLIAIGFPLMLGVVANSLLFNMDRLVILILRNKAELALYGLPIVMTRVFMQAPNIVGVVTAPRLFEKYGTRENPRDLIMMVRDGAMAITYGLPILLGAAFFLVYPVMQFWLTKYTASIPIAYLLLISAFSYCSFQMAYTTLVAVNRHYTIIAICAIFIGLEALIFYFILQFGGGIVQVALARMIVSVLYIVIIYSLAIKHLKTSFGEGLGMILLILLPIPITGLLLYGINFLPNGANLWTATGWSAIKYAIFIITQIPVLYWLNRKTGVPVRFFNIIKARWK